ncbi:MAG TPA: NAD(P)-dependent oxidoreductase [Candidatus Udaeobacter sp.]|nr:NAD(P)-dependent oxidoreductase [Candidatus Udaeobacter sp.]
MSGRIEPGRPAVDGLEIADLDEAVEHASPALPALKGASVFVTGGTGFLGRWLLAVLSRANATRGLGSALTVLTRDPDGFRRRWPQLASDPALQLVEGDVRDFVFPAGRFTHLIHGAADTSAAADSRPLELIDSIVGGTRRAFEFASNAGVGRALLLSSGAIYGAQPADLPLLPEGFTGACPPTDRRSVYGQAKRMAEQLACLYSVEFGLPAVIARGFAFVGSGLPLDGHFAIGNFIGDALAGREILVKGDGAPVRSYLYAGDAAAWMLRLLVQGQAGAAYNLGSDRAISIGELAGLVARLFPPARGLRIEGRSEPGAPRLRYVPSIDRAHKELGLEVWTALEEAIRRTGRWAAGRPTH